MLILNEALILDLIFSCRDIGSTTLKFQQTLTSFLRAEEN